MSSLMRNTMHKGFSLLELLIVILIISMVYFLGFNGIELGDKRPKALNPLNLKETLLSSHTLTTKATLLCVNNCRNCYIRANISSPFTEYESPIDLENIKAYTLDSDDALNLIEYERYQDQKICLIMDFYPNGSSTQIILEDEQQSYFLPAFFGQPQVFPSPEEAKEYWLRNSAAVSNSGDFY